STATLDATDVLSDASTTDEDIVQLSVTAATQVTNFTNLENFDVTFSNGGGDVTFVTTTGIKDIDLFGTVNASVELVDVADTGVSSIDGSALRAFGFEADLTGVTRGLTIVGSAQADIVVGGAGSDTFTMGAGDDQITDGAGADVITGGAGNDAITLANDSASDRIVFEATRSANGQDTITGFTGGGTNGDVLAVSAFLGEAVSAQIISGDTYVAGVAQDDGPLGTAASGVTAGADSNVLIVRFDTDVTTEAQLEAVINANTGALNLAGESKYVIALDNATGAGGAHQLFYVTTDFLGEVSADSVQLVGTVTTLGDLTAANFA
ncbi:MAG TPA: hypothetical protein VGN98_18350, partial [Tianweitania sediminis]|nr:hypothetical protein [Tianweitania sediminis]